MEYISVKETAKKFNISERRVQKLCEASRIDGVKMVSGVWIIPKNAKKPIDERIVEKMQSDTNEVSLETLCSEISISVATGRNWIKLGKIVPETIKGHSPFFSVDYVEKLKTDIQTGANKALKSRRNKKYISGNMLYNSYVSEHCKNIGNVHALLEIAAQSSIELDDNAIKYLIAECALQLICERMGQQVTVDSSFLEDYLLHSLTIGETCQFIDDLIEQPIEALDFIEKNKELFSLKFSYEPGEDLLGLIYISCKNINNRKATGAYYTPTKVVRELVGRLELNDSKKILDPCCGTGNFLLQLPDEINACNVYGNDIDGVSVMIARLNMILKYPNIDSGIVYHNITNSDFLLDYDTADFDVVIGNPPWGYNFTEAENYNLKKYFKVAEGRSIESYDVFIEKALVVLRKNGILAFVLPEALLNVKSHMPVRKMITNRTSIQYLSFLGNVFDGVQCPCIIMQLLLTEKPISTVNMVVNEGKRCYQLRKARNVDAQYLSFTTTDNEYAVLSKINETENVAFLEHNSIFALGIVTGNNREYITHEKTEDNEMILKGSDIYKYHVNPSKNYIVFEPEKFQQIAPTEYYRAPEKLLYRFICNQLVFAYDADQTLSLNSCNIVIPQLDGIEIKYILAILNSRIAQFIFRKRYNSVKVLKSHIEHIPIPYVDMLEQKRVIDIVDQLISNRDKRMTEQLYNELDDNIKKLFNLDDNEYRIIKETVDGENMFLI